MIERNERVVTEYKMWYPTFYERTVDITITGYHSLIAVLDDGTKLEFSTLDNALKDVTRFYDSDSVLEMSEEEWRKEYGHRLKTLLYDRSIRHDALADKLGLSRVMISKYINGKATPSTYITNRIARILDCEPGDLTNPGSILHKRNKE